jgi:hypothetical protein
MPADSEFFESAIQTVKKTLPRRARMESRAKTGVRYALFVAAMAIRAIRGCFWLSLSESQGQKIILVSFPAPERAYLRSSLAAAAYTCRAGMVCMQATSFGQILK